ncbi:MAG: lmo0937 family membrane protein [Thermoanaerobaculia bacterium]
MNILWIIAIVLVVLWLGGFALDFGGRLIHLILVMAVILIVVGFIRRRV